ncbi:MAG: NAD-dependent epimerase/dehydratase family protein [Candidatus Desulfofervidus sp.]|nr:NAD-dependent epimerase/dehydratase family protein [Candidatus Desulfofervidus sp.]
MRSYKILVTGGKGFIGTHLVAELRKRGHEVRACDLMHSGEENYIRCDVSKYRQVERIFEEHKFDYVYHLAAEYGRWNGEDYYENLWMTNVSDLVLKYVGRDDSIVTYKEAEPFTTKVKKIDCSKAIRDLGHDPKIPPEEGIQRTVEWMKSVYHREG